jgi:hypothetical protein
MAPQRLKMLLNVRVDNRRQPSILHGMRDKRQVSLIAAKHYGRMTLNNSRDEGGFLWHSHEMVIRCCAGL